MSNLWKDDPHKDFKEMILETLVMYSGHLKKMTLSQCMEHIDKFVENMKEKDE